MKGTLFEELFMDNFIVDSIGRRRRFAAPFSRLWAKLDRSAGADGCWPFQGYRTPLGYGQMSLGLGKGLILTHRLAYVIHTLQPIPPGLGVLHSCDNPPCCNVRHLRLGTHAENAADMVARRRSPHMRNELSGKAKLSDVEVDEIRRRCANGETQRSVGKAFCVHPAHVSRIVHYRRRPAIGQYSDNPPEGE